MRKQLSVLMPVFNEAAMLQSSFDTAREFLDKHGYDSEFIFVDDASTDRSAEILAKLAQQHDNVIVVTHEKNQGPCSGLKSGPAVATKPWVLLLPVDLAIPLHDIDTLWEHRGRADIALGYLQARAERSPLRRLQSNTYTHLVNRIFGMQLQQVNYVAMYRKTVFESMQLSTTGVALHAEILVRAQRAGFVIQQVPLGFQPREQGAASGSRPAVIAKTVVELLRLRSELRT